VETEGKIITTSTIKPESLKKIIDGDLMWGKVPFNL
jgi:hypothetical protein